MNTPSLNAHHVFSPGVYRLTDGPRRRVVVIVRPWLRPLLREPHEAFEGVDSLATGAFFGKSAELLTHPSGEREAAVGEFLPQELVLGLREPYFPSFGLPYRHDPRIRQL